MIFYDTSSEEEDGADEDLETAMVMILNEDFQRGGLVLNSVVLGSTEIEPRAMPRSCRTTSIPM
jgi:hypothetical protein